MAAGIEMYAPNGQLILDGTGRYARIVEVFNPFDLGVPGAREYPGLDPSTLEYMVTQGNSRVLTVTRTGSRITWTYADSYVWSEFAGTARMVVFVR